MLRLPAGSYLLLMLLFAGCQPEPDTENPAPGHGQIILKFNHTIDGQPLQFDTLMYVNQAGNPYLVNEIQYFISDVKLYSSQGAVKLIDDWKDIHYVDTDLPNTQKWEVYDKIEPGTYDSVSFTFGITGAKNLSFMYVNPPEKDMFWPEFLGGGYHYLKLNGKWLPVGQTSQTIPFDFHLGRGQIYVSYPDSISGYVDNDFNVSLPGSAFEIRAGETLEFSLTMQVENWFKDPHTYDHNVYGGYIMQNQEAMQAVRENGHNVFSLTILEIIEN